MVSNELDRRNELLDKIKKAGFPEKEVILTLDEFFIGNTSYCSIGVNLNRQPSPTVFYEIFKRLIDEGRLENVFVRIADIDEKWFFSDTIYVVGKIFKEELQDELYELQPDEINSGWMYGLPANLNGNFSEKDVYSLWWD